MYEIEIAMHFHSEPRKKRVKEEKKPCEKIKQNKFDLNFLLLLPFLLSFYLLLCYWTIDFALAPHRIRIRSTIYVCLNRSIRYGTSYPIVQIICISRKWQNKKVNKIRDEYSQFHLLKDSGQIILNPLCLWKCADKLIVYAAIESDSISY